MTVLQDHDARRPAGPDNTPLEGTAPGDLERWEDLLHLLVDPESPKVPDLAGGRRLLSFLLERAGLEEEAFWKLTRGQRGRLFLSRYSRASRDIPQLEITSFDVDKLHNVCLSSTRYGRRCPRPVPEWLADGLGKRDARRRDRRKRIDEVLTAPRCVCAARVRIASLDHRE